MRTVTPELLSRFDVAGPRYTSYPTADRFVEAFTESDYLLALAPRADRAANPPLSVYVHIPFCESLCYYCACNKIITKHPERGDAYLDYLEKELILQTQHIGRQQAVSQVHLGGGSPTFLSDAGLTRLLNLLKSHFKWVPGGEYAIEVDPRTVSPERLRFLAELGFNRLSFGVQDFDPQVQKAVHRVQSKAQIFELMASAREIGFESMNVDLIYGLPKQTLDSFRETLAQTLALRPDRVALYGYAHLPERFKPQRRILDADLPLPAIKLGLLAQALSAFQEAGYVYVGMDHFALADDALAVAKRQGRLHRNFQGYSTQPDCDLIALGVSAIGRVGTTYSQNAKTLDEYVDHLNRGHLPIVRGLSLTRDDLMRRAVIMALMCQGQVQYEAFEQAWLIDFPSAFGPELSALTALAEQGLVRLTPSSLEVTDIGWYFVRAVAMVFDQYLQRDLNRNRFSRIV